MNIKRPKYVLFYPNYNQNFPRYVTYHLGDFFDTFNTDEIDRKVKEFKLTWGAKPLNYIIQSMITELIKNQNIVTRLGIGIHKETNK